MTATVPSMIGQFNMNNIKLLQELGYEVDVACNLRDSSVWTNNKIREFKNSLENMDVSIFHVDFERKVNSINQIRAYYQIKKLMDTRCYSLIHTHTPISSLITRIAFKYSGNYKNCKMIYTAHGFHFFKGNDIVKNFLFKAIERFGARYTDVLITINHEDYQAAQKFKLRKGGCIKYVPGIGIDINKIRNINSNKEKICKELGIPFESKLLLSVGELNDNKNHKAVIKALPYLSKEVHYIICGQGVLEKYYLSLAKELGVANRLHLLGFKENVIEIMKSCDYFIFPSKREGLSVALMEAMACSCFCVVSDIRGNRDLIDSGFTGICLGVDNFTKDLLNILKSDSINISYMKSNSIKKIKEFNRPIIEEKMRKIYCIVSDY